MKLLLCTTEHIARLSWVIILLQALTLAPSLPAQQKIDVKERLRKDHPRLIFTNAVQERVESVAVNNAFLRGLISSLLRQANQMVGQPTVEYRLEGPRLLAQSRHCLAKVKTLAMAFRLSQEARFAERAIAEMQAAAAFPSWNPSHFLDVAEMCTALAIGYDWLFDLLSETERSLIKQALVEKGLKPGLQQYPDGFAQKVNNWNFVCNGGLTMAALAIADEEPQLANKIIERAFDSLPIALKSYAPDGAWFEGPSYWMYGTNYLAMFMSALKTALGSDFGFPDYPGVDKSGYFYLNSIGPSGQFFNYSDCRLRPRGVTPAIFWLAKRFDQPFLAKAERDLLEPQYGKMNARNFGKAGDHFYNRFYPLEIAWFDARNRPGESSMPLNASYRGRTDLVYFRSSFDRDALWVGFKAGHGAVNHAHLDCGSFVFEALGQRWAEDLGPDDYNLPGYFDYTPQSQRWKYFRLSSRSHNVLTINGQNQRVAAPSRVAAYSEAPGRVGAVVEMSASYEGQARSVRRGLAMLSGQQLLVQDEIIGLHDHDELRWAMLTSADIDLQGKRAVLTKGGKEVAVEIIAPGTGIFAVASTRPTYHPEEEINKGTRLLTVSIRLRAGETTRVAVLFSPQSGLQPPQESNLATIIPLAQWPGYFEQASRPASDEKQ